MQSSSLAKTNKYNSKVNKENNEKEVCCRSYKQCLVQIQQDLASKSIFCNQNVVENMMQLWNSAFTKNFHLFFEAGKKGISDIVWTCARFS